MNDWRAGLVPPTSIPLEDPRNGDQLQAFLRQYFMEHDHDLTHARFQILLERATKVALKAAYDSGLDKVTPSNFTWMVNRTLWHVYYTMWCHDSIPPPYPFSAFRPDSNFIAEGSSLIYDRYYMERKREEKKAKQEDAQSANASNVNAAQATTATDATTPTNAATPAPNTAPKAAAAPTTVQTEDETSYALLMPSWERMMAKLGVDMARVAEFPFVAPYGLAVPCEDMAPLVVAIESLAPGISVLPGRRMSRKVAYLQVSRAGLDAQLEKAWFTLLGWFTAAADGYVMPLDAWAQCLKSDVDGLPAILNIIARDGSYWELSLDLQKLARELSQNMAGIRDYRDGCDTAHAASHLVAWVKKVNTALKTSKQVPSFQCIGAD
ncbi:hypothetical protein B0I35DRAFT_482147 [Stachybotrys elegans]|uniref:Uncharacterized protein n=1 Tax=Stachybotrys elegans TaxID=80388 RepID=A0A8K0SIC8_9HYPO|nr:hypothetical protein B0I35DRAFT_482147 [Stachybotrys elegans]